MDIEIKNTVTSLKQCAAGYCEGCAYLPIVDCINRLETDAAHLIEKLAERAFCEAMNVEPAPRRYAAAERDVTEEQYIDELKKRVHTLEGMVLAYRDVLLLADLEMDDECGEDDELC